MSESVEALSLCPLAAQWKKIGLRHHHGVNVPLFALRSTQSCGIGEFEDLLPLIDWAAEVGFDLIQLLPLNDTGVETSPFSALSAFALDSKYLTLSALPHANDYPNLVMLLDTLRTLNGAQYVQYEKVVELKQLFLRQYISQECSTLAATAEFRQFVEENPWLSGYGLFKALKSRYHQESWENWPAEIRDPQASTLAELSQAYRAEITYHQIVQYLCYQQLRRVRNYAESKGLFLKGDVPILVSRESADVWLYRHLFNMALTAGAPPDPYSEEGQKWGLPIYEWSEHRKDKFRWWRERLRFVSHFYHLYRLDHIVGFFRFYAIPVEATAKEGFYLPGAGDGWAELGKEILTALAPEYPMLPIGEDLGVIPEEMRAGMKAIGIAGTKIPRWERLWQVDRSYIPPSEFTPLSMTTISTHDSETFRLWWSAHPEEARAYAADRHWPFTPEWTPQLQLKALREAHHSGSLFHIDLLQEYLALYPELVWPTAEEERINVPGTVLYRNWRYRFQPSIDKIIHHEGLKRELQALLKEQP